VRGSSSVSDGLCLVPPQLTRGFVSVDGSLYAGANIGVLAFGYNTATTTTKLVEFPIPGAAFIIPNVVTVGASARLDATTEVTLTARGRLLIGASLTIPNFSARLDVVNSGTSGITGFEPVFTPRFDASGEVSASLALGLPAQIGIGLKFPALKINKQIGLRNTPRLLATALLRATTDVEDQSYCINGLAYDVGITDTIYSDFAGSLKQLAQFRKPGIFKDCLP
jgi:hypothetical protein